MLVDVAGPRVQRMRSDEVNGSTNLRDCKTHQTVSRYIYIYIMYIYIHDYICNIKFVFLNKFWSLQASLS